MDETTIDYRYYNTDLISNGQNLVGETERSSSENILPPEMQPFSTGSEHVYEDTGSREAEHQYSSIYEVPGNGHRPIGETKKDVLQIGRSKFYRILLIVILFVILLISGSGLLGYILGSNCADEIDKELKSEVVQGFNECDEYLCYNGTCMRNESGVYCACFPGFVGEQCENDIDDCASNPCGNQGSCIDGNNTYTCVCDATSDGPNCLEEWTLVFRGTAGAGSDIYRVLNDGEDATTTDITCMTTDVTLCNRHYRHPIVDSWKSLGIKKVKLSFFKSNKEQAYIIFNGTGSDMTSWFDRSRINESSWSNMASEKFQLFSIFGNDPWRRFLISRHLGRCSDDVMYIATIVPHHYSCNYDEHSEYPQFLYSTTNSYGYPESLKGFDTADVMAIFIQY